MERPRMNGTGTNWLGLMVGNSRLHWAWFEGDRVCYTWDSPHAAIDGARENTAGTIGAIAPSEPPAIPYPESLPELEPQPGPKLGSELEPESRAEFLLEQWQSLSLNTAPLAIASVVPKQTQLWRNRPHSTELTLDHITLTQLYPTLGIDRALAALGAFHHWGGPVLVIDGGTALTFTGVDGAGALMGGAIAPGLRLQLRSLHHHTAALPNVMIAGTDPVPRWNRDTPNAILSGVWHTMLAGVEDFIQAWMEPFPQSQVVFTGGDGKAFHQALQQRWAQPGAGQQKRGRSLHFDPIVGFRGMAIARTQI